MSFLYVFQKMVELFLILMIGYIYLWIICKGQSAAWSGSHNSRNAGGYKRYDVVSAIWRR